MFWVYNFTNNVHTPQIIYTCACVSFDTTQYQLELTTRVDHQELEQSELK